MSSSMVLPGQFTSREVRDKLERLYPAKEAAPVREERETERRANITRRLAYFRSLKGDGHSLYHNGS